MGEIILGDNLDVLPTLPDGAFQLIYVDPPFNTGKPQSRTRIRVTPDTHGDRTGFQGRRYRTEVVGESRYADRFGNGGRASAKYENKCQPYLPAHARAPS